MLRNLFILCVLALCLGLSGGPEAKANSIYDDSAINFLSVGYNYSYNSYVYGARDVNAYYAYYYGYYAYYYAYVGDYYNDYNYWATAYTYAYYANYYATTNFTNVGYDAGNFSYYAYYYTYYGYLYTYYSYYYFV